MTCLRCGSPLELVVAIHERGLPPAHPDHDTVHDWSRVLSCPSCGYGDLRHFSHDCWPSEEDIDMAWSTQLAPAALAMVRSGLATCPDPSAPACACTVHMSLRDTEKRVRRLGILPPEDGERPDAPVVLRADGVPEFGSRVSGPGGCGGSR